MSAKEVDKTMSLMNLQKSLEREKYLHKVMIELRQENYEFWEAIRRNNDKIVMEYEELMRNNKYKIQQLKRAKKAIMRLREEHVREFINKEGIYVSNPAHLEAVIFLRRKGWTGKALIHQEEFATKLSENNIPFILEVSK